MANRNELLYRDLVLNGNHPDVPSPPAPPPSPEYEVAANADDTEMRHLLGECLREIGNIRQQQQQASAVSGSDGVAALQMQYETTLRSLRRMQSILHYFSLDEIRDAFLEGAFGAMPHSPDVLLSIDKIRQVFLASPTSICQYEDSDVEFIGKFLSQDPSEPRDLHGQHYPFRQSFCHWRGFFQSVLTSPAWANLVPPRGIFRVNAHTVPTGMGRPVPVVSSSSASGIPFGASASSGAIPRRQAGLSVPTVGNPTASGDTLADALRQLGAPKAPIRPTPFDVSSPVSLQE